METHNNQRGLSCRPDGESTGVVKRKRGGQSGNQNARTHGFYSRSLTPEQQEQLRSASSLLDLDQEIALVRLKIRSILDTDPDNHEALLLATSLLTRMIMVNSAFKLRCFAWGGLYLKKIGREDYLEQLLSLSETETTEVPPQQEEGLSK